MPLPAQVPAAHGRARSKPNPFAMPLPPKPGAQSLPAAMGSAFVRGAADVPLATAQSAARAAGTAHLLPEFEAIERGEQPPGLLDISRRPPIEKTLLRQYAQAAPERRAEIKARAQQPVTESPVYKAAERGRAAVEGAFPVDPAQGERFLTKAAGGLGSTLGFAVTGIAGRALGMPAMPVTAATGAAANSQAQFQQAINSGASFEEATRASQISGLAGLTEALPISRFLDRFDKAMGGTIRKAIREGLKGGVEESVQEIFQAIVDNATARGIYDPERALITGSGEAGAIGFSVGSLLSFLGSALGARMRGAPQPPPGAPGATTAAPGTGVPPGAPSPAGAPPAPDLLGEIFGPDVGERAAPDLGVPEPMARFEMGGEAGGQFIETQRARAQLEESRRNIERTEREIAERQERIDSLTGTATGQMVEPMRARASMPPPPAPRETGGPATGRFLETMRGAATMPPAQLPARLGAIRARGSATGQFVEPQTAAVEMPPEPAPPKPDVPAFAGPVRPSEVVLPPAVVPETSPRPPAAVTPPAEEHPGLVIKSLETGRTEVIQPPGTRPPEAAGPPIQTPPPPRVEAPQPAPQSGRGQDWRAVMANRWPHQLSEDERGQVVEALGVADFDEATRELDRRGYAPEASAPAAAPAPAQAPARAPEPKAPSPPSKPAKIDVRAVRQKPPLERTDAENKAFLKHLESLPFKSAAQEREIELTRKRVEADPAKWKAGQGVGWRTQGNQINRGFQVVSVDPEMKVATIRQVADTGLTSTGSDFDRIGETQVHVADLVRDKKYDRREQPAAATAPATAAPAELSEGAYRHAMRYGYERALNRISNALRLKKLPREVASTLEWAVDNRWKGWEQAHDEGVKGWAPPVPMIRSFIKAREAIEDPDLKRIANTIIVRRNKQGYIEGLTWNPLNALNDRDNDQWEELRAAGHFEAQAAVDGQTSQLDPENQRLASSWSMVNGDLQTEGLPPRKAEIKEPAAKPARKIETLTQFLKRRGGIRETAAVRGELRARDITNKRRPGLISNKGMTLDDATLAAWEAGFLPGGERPALDALLSALERDLRDKNVVRETDQAEADVAAEQAAAQETEERVRQEIKDYAREIGEHLKDAEIAEIMADMIARDVDAASAVSDFAERLAVRTAEEGADATGDQSYTDDIPFEAGSPATPDVAAVEGPAGAAGPTLPGEAGGAVAAEDGQAARTGPISLAGVSTEDPGRLAESDFIKLSDLRAAERAAYFDEQGNKLTSSRTTPARQIIIPDRAWVIDDGFKGNYGRDIEQYRLLDPNTLVPQEDSRDRLADVDRYAEWLSQGLRPPPIRVTEAENGELRVSDGHRRYRAALRAGVPVPALVSPAAEIGRLDSQGKPIKVGLTYELAQQKPPRPTTEAAPEVPPAVRERVRQTLDYLREIEQRVAEAAELERRVGGRGRYQADTFTNRAKDIEKARSQLAEFRRLAREKGIDPEAVIADLGGEPALTPSPEAQAWLERPDQGPIETAPSPTTETTPEGEQYVIPSAEQRGQREVLERRMGARDVRGGQRGLEGLGLFDEGARAQQDDLFSSPARFGRKPVPQAERDELAGILERLVRQINPDPALAVEFAKEMWASGPTMARHGVDPTQTFEQSGSYSPVQHLIRLSLNITAPERVAAAAHEAWHSVERLLTKSERAVLRNIYPSIKGGKVHVERAAEAFEEWLVANHAQKQKFKPAVRRVFEKIARFLERLGNALRGRGYQTVEDIFGRAFQGEVGARHPEMPGGTATVHPDTGTPLSVRALQGAPPEIQQIARQPGNALLVPVNRDSLSMVKAYHGSPHRFDKFSLDKIGTGEGAQAYGHGLYFAENPAIAGHYRDMLGGQGKLTIDGVSPGSATEYRIAYQIAKNPATVEISIKALRDQVAHLEKNKADVQAGRAKPEPGWGTLGTTWGRPEEDYLADRRGELAWWEDLSKANIKLEETPGALYNVSLDVEPEDLLDWDAPLSQQSEKVRRGVAQALGMGTYKPITEKDLESFGNLTGQELYEGLSSKLFREGLGGGNSAGAASRALADAGIPGLRYFDAGSRGKGEGSRNVVMFRDDLIRIEEVDGQPVEGDQTFSSLRRQPYDDTGGQVELHAGLPINKIWDWWLGPFFQRFYEPFGRVPQRDELLKARYSMFGEADMAGDLTRQYQVRLMRHPEATRDQIYQYMTTPGAAPTMITDPVARQDGIDMKQIIKRMARELVYWGVLKPAQEAKYRDRYLPRLYIKFLLQENLVDVSGGNRPKMTRAMMGHTKKRNENISRFERDVLWGEVKDPAYLVPRAFGLASHTIAIMRFLDRVSQNNDWVWADSLVSWRGRKYSAHFLKAEAERLRETYKSWPNHLHQQVLNAALAMEQAASTAAQPPPADVVKQYKQVPDTKRYGTLRGLWIRKQIYDDLVGSAMIEAADETLNWLLKQWRGGINYWKMSRTSLNIPQGHVRNHVGGVFQSTVLGGVGWFALPSEYLKTIKDLAQKGPRYQETIRHGGRSTSFATSELAKIHAEFTGKLKQRQYGLNPLRFVREAAVGVTRAAGNAYSGNEFFWKALVMGYYMDRGMPADEANLKAQSAIFDYSLVPQLLRGFRENVPFGAPFATFMYKVLPTSLETLFTRPWAYWPVGALIGGLSTAAMWAFDWDDDDQEAVRALMPEYMQGWQTVILPFKDRYGRYLLMDLSYFFPFGGWVKAAGALADGEILKAIDELGMMNNPGVQIPRAIATNQDSLGRPIWDEGDSGGQQWMDMIWWLIGQGMPPMLAPEGSIRQLYNALTGYPDRHGNMPRSPIAGAFRFGGFTTHALDPEVAFEIGTSRHMREIRDTEALMRRKAREYGSRIGALQEQGKDTADLERAMQAELERLIAETRKRAEEMTAWQQKVAPALELAR